MSSSSSNNMEEDAWLMKIELKRVEPTDTIKGGRAKEATVDPPSVVEQALLVKEEEEDILSLTLLILPLMRLKPFASLK